MFALKYLCLVMLNSQGLLKCDDSGLLAASLAVNALAIIYNLYFSLHASGEIGKVGTHYDPGSEGKNDKLTKEDLFHNMSTLIFGNAKAKVWVLFGLAVVTMSQVWITFGNPKPCVLPPYSLNQIEPWGVRQWLFMYYFGTVANVSAWWMAAICCVGCLKTKVDMSGQKIGVYAAPAEPGTGLNQPLVKPVDGKPDGPNV